MDEKKRVQDYWTVYKDALIGADFDLNAIQSDQERISAFQWLDQYRSMTQRPVSEEFEKLFHL